MIDAQNVTRCMLFDPHFTCLCVDSYSTAYSSMQQFLCYHMQIIVLFKVIGKGCNDAQ